MEYEDGNCKVCEAHINEIVQKSIQIQDQFRQIHDLNTKVTELKDQNEYLEEKLKIAIANSADKKLDIIVELIETANERHTRQHLDMVKAIKKDSLVSFLDPEGYL